MYGRELVEVARNIYNYDLSLFSQNQSSIMGSSLRRSKKPKSDWIKSGTNEDTLGNRMVKGAIEVTK